ncbi:unnamed protein product [Effrenium voratum]|nr:unnamed protein product [Effrenium voratum]
MVLLEAFGLASKELFDYNRENYKFDQEQRLERDMQRVEMQINRFDLFREDIEDLVKLTVDKMDMYHIVGALFLSFTALVYCEGIIEGTQPPFFMGQYFLTVAASFVYLLLAVWLSMYASIASHSFGVRLRTRYVRLPIPNLNQIQSLTTKLSDFEKQGLSKMMRLPFGPTGAQAWQLEAQRGGAGAGQSQLAAASGSNGGANGASQKALPDAPREALPETCLGEQGDLGFGREDTLMKAAASVPGKHVELFRKLQAKWQCYDAYARISMALGVNQMIQSVNYFVVGATMIQTCSPSCGYAATVIFQACTFGLMFLDIAGLKTWEIMCLQIIGSMPMVVLVVMLTFANQGRASNEHMDPLCKAFYASPACAFLEALWLELFMQTARPTKDEASLPRKFRTVLFLDVFGDAAYDPTEAEHACVTAGVDGRLDEQADDMKKREIQQTQAAAAIFALEGAQSALRCWEAVPQEILTGVQISQLQNLRTEYSEWRHRYHGCLSKMKSRRGVPYDPVQQDARALRGWEDLTTLEKQQDEFYGALVGPLQRRADASSSQYYDLVRNVPVWTLEPGAKVLDMQKAVDRVQNVEHEVTALLRLERADLEALGVPEEDIGAKALLFKSRKRAGHHRLPWKSIRRMTAVLQVCWVFLGVQSLLSSQGLWANSVSLGRRLSQDGLAWREVPAEWPHRSFFQPSTLSCQRGSHGVILGSPYLQYQLKFSADMVSLSPLPFAALPSGTTVLDCSLLGDCATARLQQGGAVILISLGPMEGQKQTWQLRLQGRPWSKVAGMVASCASVELLAGVRTGTCLVLAGWDGEHVPLVALALPSNATESVVVAPRVDAPLGPGFNFSLTDLHVSAAPPRLWALQPGRVEAWDLVGLRNLGTWKLDKDLEATSLCEADRGLLLAGFLWDEPRLFRSELPLGA